MADLARLAGLTLTALRGVTKTGNHLVRETVQSGALGCELDRNFSSASANNKPRRKAGLCGSVQDRAFGQKKRVNGFERVDIHVGNVQAHRPSGINRVDFLR